MIIPLQWQKRSFVFFRASVDETATPEGQSHACPVGGYAITRICSTIALTQDVRAWK